MPRERAPDLSLFLDFLHYRGLDPELSAAFDESHAWGLGADMLELWDAIKAAARREADD